MKEIRVKIGRGNWHRTVAFTGEYIGEFRRWGEAGDGFVDLTLFRYQTDDGRLAYIVYIQHRLLNKVLDYIEKVALSDLQVGGPWEDLGWATGLATPLTVEEGLQYSREVRREEGV